MLIHRDYAKKSSNRTRKWDKKTPYSIHPLWCATTILTETSLPEDMRENGYLALLYHDVLEDTTANLSGLPEKVNYLIKQMTFKDFSAEMRAIWTKEPDVKLLKLYDKVSNLLDGSWMNNLKRRIYIDYTRKLAKEVEEIYGNLNIVRIFKSLSL
jgi:(p)ppGpp synthase/HD superfamily hydrolase